MSVTDVEVKLNKKHKVTEITVDFSGAVNAAEADNLGTYRLAKAGKKGSFTAKNAVVLGLRSAAYDTALEQVTLTPKKAFALTKSVQLVVNGQSLHDSAGDLIDGANDGQPGTNFVKVLSPAPAASFTPTATPTPTPVPVSSPVTLTPIPVRTPAATPTPAPTPTQTPTPTPTPTPFPGY